MALTSIAIRIGSPTTVTSPSRVDRPTMMPGTAFSAERMSPRTAPSVMPKSTEGSDSSNGMRRPARASSAIPERMRSTQLSSTSGLAAASASISCPPRPCSRSSASSASWHPGEPSIDGSTGSLPASR